MPYYYPWRGAWNQILVLTTRIVMLSRHYMWQKRASTSFSFVLTGFPTWLLSDADLHRTANRHVRCFLLSSETSGLCQVRTGFQNICSREYLFCINTSPSLILSTAPQVATHIWPESAKRLWAVTTRSESQPYLAEPVVKKKKREKSQVAKNSKE